LRFHMFWCGFETEKLHFWQKMSDSEVFLWIWRCFRSCFV
jgi:hypothetical protein